VRALCPEPLETARLGEALTAVARRWTERGGVPVQVTVTGTARPVKPEAESALLRTAQEALTNVAKHAAATRVGVTLSYMDDEVVLDVRDDGAGFDLVSVRDAGDIAPERAGGFGLSVMRQRIEGQSGTFRVESEPGFGTAISVSVPVQPCGEPEAESASETVLAATAQARG
jgi:signal transduction histidine kinase